MGLIFLSSTAGFLREGVLLPLCMLSDAVTFLNIEVGHFGDMEEAIFNSTKEDVFVIVCLSVLATLRKYLNGFA